MAPEAPPGASESSARRDRGSVPYRDHEKECHKRAKHETEIAPDGQKLQHIEPIGQECDGVRQRGVEEAPNDVLEFQAMRGRPGIARQRNYDFFAHAKHERSEDAPNRLRKAASGVLRL